LFQLVCADYYYKQQGGTFKVRQLRQHSGHSPRDVYIAPLQYCSFAKEDEIKILPRTYWHASSQTFPCVDAFVTSSELGSICGIQYTITAEHEIKHETLKEKLANMGFIADGKWSEGTFDIYFVVPSNIFMTMPEQEFLTTQDTSFKNHPFMKDYTRQFAMEMSLMPDPPAGVNEGNKQLRTGELQLSIGMILFLNYSVILTCLLLVFLSQKLMCVYIYVMNKLDVLFSHIQSGSGKK
jgi:hypothetical protein